MEEGAELRAVELVVEVRATRLVEERVSKEQRWKRVLRGMKCRR